MPAWGPGRIQVSNNRVRGYFSNGKLNALFLGLFALIIIYSAIMTFNVLRLTPSLTQETPKEDRVQRIIYDYRVYPLPSTLFPPGTGPLPAGEKSYYMNITQKIEFEATGEIETPYLTEPQGDFRINLLLRSPGQWEKKMDYTPIITTQRPAEGKLVFTANFDLPLAAAEALGEMIAEELGVRPRDAYSLVIQSSIICPSLDPGTVSSGSTVAGEYEFVLRGRTIEPVGELRYEKKETSPETALQANYISLWGHPLDVSRARILFPVLLLASLLGLGLFSLACFRPGSAARHEGNIELDSIRRRYGGRIIKVGELKDIPLDGLKIEMQDFKELVRIADERERPILQADSQKDQNPNLAQFYVVDDNTLYFYKIEAIL